MTVLEKILAWGKDRPQWQQVALQLLYESPSLGPEKRQLIADVCLKEHGLLADVGAVPALELAGGLAAGPVEPTILLGIRDTKNVNALQAGQHLTFAPSGITLIFGDNGVGKSGYVRILKQVCRARGGRDPLHPHAYSDDKDPPSATIEYQVGGAGPTAFDWTPGVAGKAALWQVSILDSKSAVVYAGEDQEIAYLPFGLDLFQRLASLCDQMGEDFERAISKETLGKDLFPDIRVGTRVAEALAVMQLPATENVLRSMRVLTESESAELAGLRAEEAQLAFGDPIGRAAELELQAKRVALARESVVSLAALVTEESVAALGELRQSADSLDGAAKAAADGTFAHFPIKGLSERTWSDLWKAARAFATTGAQPRQGFPPKEGERCVLCQQPVGVEAAGRLEAFDTFIRQRLAADAIAAKEAYTNAVKPIALAVSEKELGAEQLEELNAIDPGLGDALLGALRGLRERGRAVVGAAPAIPRVPGELAQAVGGCEQIRQSLVAQAAVLRESGAADRLESVRRRIHEFEARIKLDEVWGRVESELARWQMVRKLDECRKSTTTTGITIKGKELLAEAVTEPLTRRFNDNLKALRLEHIPIEFAPEKGRKGSVLHRVRIAAATPVPNGEILSEGEFRAIAIAGFLAEVQEQESSSTLVFDDPVSSLDLGRREFVAGALVNLAKTRPVVVFTHDMPFAWQITEAAGDAAVTVTERQLWRIGGAVGAVSNAIASSGKPAKKRIGPLKQRAVELKKLAESDPLQYDRAARGLYTELRSTWERAVEDSLLNGGVRRFGKEIKTQSLGKLHLITEAHMVRLEAGMSKCSKFMHDQAPDITQPIPAPAELVADATECEAWMTEVKKLVE